MTGFSLDFNETYEGFDKIQDGTYEVIIEKVNEDATQGGAEFTNFQMVIRNDIQQEHKNQKVWHRNWKAKETGKYNMIMFNTIGKAAQLQNGKTYKSFEELLNDYVGKPLKVTVKNETSEYNGKTYENLNIKKWEQTGFPQVQHQFKTSSDSPSNMTFEQQQASGIDINDDDLPF